MSTYIQTASKQPIRVEDCLYGGMGYFALFAVTCVGLLALGSALMHRPIRTILATRGVKSDFCLGGLAVTFIGGYCHALRKSLNK